MKPISKGEAITFDDGKEFFVIDIVYVDDVKYIYFARDEKDFEFLIGKEVFENEEIFVDVVDDKNIIDQVMLKVSEQLK